MIQTKTKEKNYNENGEKRWNGNEERGARNIACILKKKLEFANLVFANIFELKMKFVAYNFLIRTVIDKVFSYACMQFVCY